jgi:hypothetical protein
MNYEVVDEEFDVPFFAVNVEDWQNTPKSSAASLPRPYRTSSLASELLEPKVPGAELLALSSAGAELLSSHYCLDLSKSTDRDLLTFLENPNHIVIQSRELPQSKDRYGVELPQELRISGTKAYHNNDMICAKRIPFHYFLPADLKELNKPLIDEGFKTFRNIMINMDGKVEHYLVDADSHYKFYKPENRFFVFRNYRNLTAYERNFWRSISASPMQGAPLLETKSPTLRGLEVDVIRNETMIEQRMASYFTLDAYTIEDYIRISTTNGR